MTIKINGDTLPLTITELDGFQAPSISVLTTPYALTDGSYYHGDYVLSRKLRIAGVLDGNTPNEIITSRDTLWEMLTIGEEFTLQYQLLDTLVEIDAIYDDGLEDASSPIDAEVSFSLICPYPYFKSASNTSATLQVNQTLPMVFEEFIRGETGVWFNSPIPSDASVIRANRNNFFQHTQDKLHLTAKYRCAHDGVGGIEGVDVSGFDALQGTQQCYLVNGNDAIYSCGRTLDNNNNNIIMWNGSNWVEQQLLTGAQYYRGIITTPFGIFVARNDTSVASAKIYQSKDGTTWNEVISFPVGEVWSILPYNSLLLVCGTFTGGAALYDPVTFAEIKSLDLSTSTVSAKLHRGNLYSGGYESLFYWGGGDAQIISLPSAYGGPELFSNVFNIVTLGDTLYVFDDSTSPPTSTYTVKVDNQFYPHNMLIPFDRCEFGATRNFLVLCNFVSGTALPSSQTIAYTGTQEVSPVFTFQGSGNIYTIEVFNYVNGIIPIVSFGEGYNITTGETLTIDCNDGSVVSSISGNIINELVPNSRPAAMVLRPGNNVVGILAENTVTGTLSWENEWVSGDA